MISLRLFIDSWARGESFIMYKTRFQISGSVDRLWLKVDIQIRYPDMSSKPFYWIFIKQKSRNLLESLSLLRWFFHIRHLLRLPNLNSIHFSVYTLFQSSTPPAFIDCQWSNQNYPRHDWRTIMIKNISHWLTTTNPAPNRTIQFDPRVSSQNSI